MQASAGPLTERPAAGSVAEFIYLNKMKNFEARTHRESKTFYHLVEVGPGRAGVSEGPMAARVLPRGVCGQPISPAHFTDGAGLLRPESATAGGLQAGGGGRPTWARLLAPVVPTATLPRRGGWEPVAVRLAAAAGSRGRRGRGFCPWPTQASWAEQTVGDRGQAGPFFGPHEAVHLVLLCLWGRAGPRPRLQAHLQEGLDDRWPHGPSAQPSGAGPEQEPDHGAAHAARPHAHARALQPQPPAQRPRRRAPADDPGGPRRQAGAGGRQVCRARPLSGGPGREGVGRRGQGAACRHGGRRAREAVGPEDAPGRQ